MKRRTVVLTFAAVILTVSCELLFVPLERRTNPLDPDSAVAGITELNAVASSDTSVLLRIRVREDSDRRPAGFLIVRSGKRKPVSMNDGEKIWTVPTGTDGYTFTIKDENLPESDPAFFIEKDRTYYYAVWSYDDEERIFVGPYYDEAVTTLFESTYIYPWYGEDDGYVSRTEGFPAITEFSGIMSVRRDTTNEDRSAGLVRFTIDDYLDGAYAVSAILHLTPTSGYGGPDTMVHVNRIIQGWSSGDIADDLFDRAMSADFITTEGAGTVSFLSGTPQYADIPIDITEIMNAWLGFGDNHGILIFVDETGATSIEFGTSDIGWSPFIEILHYPDDPHEDP